MNSLDILKRRKPIKIIIKIQLSILESSENKLTQKISAKLSQMGIYDSNIADLFLEKYFEKLETTVADPESFRLKHFSLNLPLAVNIFRKKQKTDFLMFGPSLSDIIKKYSDRRKFVILRNFRYRFRRTLKFNSLQLFKFVLLNQILIDNDSPLCNIYKNFSSIQGILLSIKLRKEMKRRKIDFRRKHGKYKK